MSRTLTQLRQAVALLQQGKLAEAIGLSQAILRAEPSNFDALHIVALASYHGRDLATAQRHIEKALAVRQDMPDAYNTHGLILRAAQRPAEAAEQFARAAKLNPRSREAHYNLANCLQDLGRLPAALEHYDQALKVEPGMAMAWNNRGLVLRRMGRPADALASFEEAIRRGRDFAPAHYNKADCLAALSRPEEAVRSYDVAIALRPDFAEAHCNRANALIELGRPEEALAGYGRATSLQPRFHQAHLSRGIALAALGRPAEAEASFRTALALRPDYADAHYNLGRILRELGRLEEAVEAYDAAIRLRPGHAETHSNRANALKDLRRFDDALTSYDTAIKLNPGLAEAHYNRGNVLGELKRVDEALAAYDAALGVRGDYAEVLNNKSHLLLGAGRFAEGFALYDARRESISSGTPALRTEVAAWDGRQGEGELLVWAEQGIGDEILHGSLLWLMPEGPLGITVAADRRLHAIYRRSLPERFRLIDSASLKEGIGAPYTAQAPVGDLGKLLGVDAAGLGRRPSPFLVADEGRRAGFRAALSGSGPVVGLSWKSSNPRIGSEKSLRLRDLAPVLQVAGVSFVNLQYGAVSGDIAAVGEELGVRVREAEGLDVFNDIDGLLALVDACDVVVTTSNVTAHLAGALGKRAAVMVPGGRGCLWYWQGGCNDLWYPSLTRIAQPRIGEWDGAIAAAAAWLREETR